MKTVQISQSQPMKRKAHRKKCWECKRNTTKKLNGLYLCDDCLKFHKRLRRR